MIPIKTNQPLFERPYVTFGLIAFNLAIFLSGLQGDGRGGELRVLQYGLVPRALVGGAEIAFLTVEDELFAAADLTAGEIKLLDPRLAETTFWLRLSRMPTETFRSPFTVDTSHTRVDRLGRVKIFDRGEIAVVPVTSKVPSVLSIFTSMFLHAGWLHLLGNLWFLWLFGPSVEDVLGRAKFLAFYLLTGTAAAAAHVGDDLGSVLPCIGASGAIAGVMGGFLLLFPRSEVMAIGPMIMGGLIRLPAFIFLGFYLLEQIFMSLTRSGGGTAWWAHIGGFVAGMALIKALPPKPEWAEVFGKRRPSGRRFGYDDEGRGPSTDDQWLEERRRHHGY